MTTISSSNERPTRPYPMVTACLALELLQSSQNEMSSVSAVVETKIASLQRALRETTASAPPSKDDLSASPSSASTVSVSAAVSTSSSDESSVASWDEEDQEETEQEEEEEEEEDRCRMGAAAIALSRLSLDDESLPKRESFSGMRRQASFEEGNEDSPLDEFSHHPALSGPVACLHGYAASACDPVFLEKAYEMARTVAASKHELSVVLDACRIALAVGFVHTLTKGAPGMANTFAQQHSLSKLAQSLRPYWARSPGSTQEEEWNECMLSLLEIASSVAVMTGERDVLSDLDVDVYAGVTEAIGSYLVRKPSALRQYHDVGSVCLRHHLLSAGMGSRRSTDSE